MDLLAEARNGNKEAFLELTEDLFYKMYKTARIYFTDEQEVVKLVKYTYKKLYKEMINVRKEEQLTFFAMLFLIKRGEELYLKKSGKTKKVTNISENTKETFGSYEKYKKYMSMSIEEDSLKMLNKNDKLIAVLYFYDGLDIRDIAILLKKSSKDVQKVIDKVRNQLYQIISNEGTKIYNEYVK